MATAADATASFWSSATLSPTVPSATGLPGDNLGSGRDEGGGGKGGETLQEWSSLIGIITAIVGNVLIALALNVQRYAHTRLHRERTRIRLRANAALKRAQGAQHGVYGSINRIHESNNGHNNGHGHGNSGAGVHVDDANRDLDLHDESAPLNASFASGRAAESQGHGESGAEHDEGDNSNPASSYLRSPYWWLGQILITLGEMGNFLAYGFAPASIVSPLGVVALVSNCIIAPVMFHERFRLRDFWGVVIAVGGVVTVVLSANQEETKLNPHDVWDAITTLAFEIYLGVTIFLIMVLMWASGKYGKQTILIDLGLVGLFGGYTALATKGVSSMLSSTLWGAFATPVTYVLLVILLGTAIMQIRYVNRALQRFDSTQVIPIQFVMFTLCVIIGSAVLYRDFEKTTPKQAGKFVGGCLLTFFGVFLITSGRHRNEDEEDMLSEAEGIEETIGLARHDSHHTQPQPPSVSQSRRSSKAGLLESLGGPSPAAHIEGDAAALRGAVSPGSQRSAGRESVPFFSTVRQSSWDSPSTTPRPARGPRTLSVDSVAVASPMESNPATSYPVTPQDELQGQLSVPELPTERPVPPRQGHSSKSFSHHRSGTFISPSPLSSTVTTVVKDAFLRAKDGPRAGTSSLRRIRSSIRASLFFGDDDSASDHQGAGARTLASDTSLVRGLDGEAIDDPTRRRSRSLSDTLGEFLRPRRSKRKGMFHSDVEEDDEEGNDSDGERPLDRSPGAL
ncbi:hypothetical protein S40288_00248 [Stachybotrys chartarum IBT 40288]|nr:hypothetical protein S40288_00248 [Stachybotrys chartarum IBT 40288]